MVFVLLALIFLGVILTLFFKEKENSQNQLEKTQPRVWQVKSIDTMKYSRDLTGQKLNDQTFDQVIETQIKVLQMDCFNWNLSK